MRHFISRTGITSLLVMALLVLCSCDEEGQNSSPVGPDISGDWSGNYHIGGGPSTPISASITQNGDATVVETSLSGEGHLLTGTMDGEGNMYMTDAFDGETWTSAGPATASRVVLIDFLAGGGTALKTIELGG
jgi:hypothetical protein